MTLYGTHSRMENDFRDEIGSQIDRERFELHQLARQLSHSAIRHWQKTVEGLVALPAALATGAAASTLRVVAMVADGFDAFSRSTDAMRRALDDAQHEVQARRETRKIEEQRTSPMERRAEAAQLERPFPQG